jgi:hypothetical protein
MLVLLVGWKMLAGGGGGAVPFGGGGAGSGGGTSTTSGSGSYADPNAPGKGTATAAFAKPVVGTRVQMNVLALGDHPERCVPASLQLGGDVRTVYHHSCEGVEPGSDTYYFLVRITNLTKEDVPVRLDHFRVIKASGEAQAPLGERPPTATETFFPTSTVLGPNANFKGWITFDGSPSFTPASLRYLDGQESLIVAFRGNWVSPKG